jgi:hypothetical protein
LLFMSSLISDGLSCMMTPGFVPMRCSLGPVAV